MASKDGSPKLTATLRAALAKAIYDERKGALGREQQEKGDALALAIYNRSFTEAERRKMKRLPDGWLPHAYSIQARFGTREVHIDSRRLNLRIPESSRQGYALVAEANDPLASQAIAYEALRTMLSFDELERMYREIKQALLNFRTVNQLLEGWPEVEKIIRPVIKQASEGGEIIRVVDLANLNRKLGFTE